MMSIRKRPSLTTQSFFWILEALAEVDILEVQSPAVLVYNLDYRHETVSKNSANRLTEAS